MSVKIRVLADVEIDSACTLSTTAGWNQRPADWRMLVRLAPSGAFAAWDGDRIVATAIGIDYGTFGWVAMMLVAPEYRGQGIGARLLESAMSAIPAEAPIRLDATPMGRPLYERYGFEPEASLTRHVSRPEGRRVVDTRAGRDSSIRPMAHADLADVQRHDARVFGADRAGVLGWMLAAGHAYAHVVEGSDGAGYCLGRDGRLFDQIGPVVSDDEAAACALVSAAIRQKAHRPVVVDAFDDGGGFSRWLHASGFTAERPLYRMGRPGANGLRFAGVRAGVREFGILGPEFA